MSADIEEQYDKIYRYCYFKTQNAALAEDLTQECFLKYISQNTYVEFQLLPACPALRFTESPDRLWIN